MWRTSSRRDITLIETATAPRRTSAWYAIANSGTLGRKSPTRPPGPMPARQRRGERSHQPGELAVAHDAFLEDDGRMVAARARGALQALGDVHGFTSV
jgi:hypothetical protein